MKLMVVERLSEMSSEKERVATEQGTAAVRFPTSASGELSWQQVHAIHGSLAGISTKGGVVRSLLANQMKDGTYADEIQHDVIFYRVTAQTNPRSVQCLKAMIGTAKAFLVFEKVGINRWLAHGEWIAADSAEEAEGSVFLLKRAP